MDTMRRLVTMGFTLIVLLVATGANAPVASAADYHVYSCRTPAGGPAPTDGWTGSTSGPNDDDINGCSTGGALTVGLEAPISHPANMANAVWTFSTAPSLSLHAATIYRSEALPGGVGANSSYVTAFYSPNFAYDAANVFDNCQASIGCTGHGTSAVPLDPSNRVVVPAAHIAGSTRIYMEARCGGTNGAYCPPAAGDFAARADLYAADLTLSDNTDPQVGNPGGPLLAGGTLTGVQDVTFNASDTGSGVYSAAFVVDGSAVSSQVIDSNGGSCHAVGQATDGRRDFLTQAPCKPSVSPDVSLDTSTLSNGPHALRILVGDAAGNTSTLYSGTITTRNANGPHGAHVANGTGACNAAAHLSARIGGRTVARVALNRSAELRGALGCGARPISGALIDATVTPAAGAATQTQVRTAADGTFALPLPRGPSRRITLNYRAFADDANPAASAVAEVRVMPSIVLTIRPRRARNGQTISYRGRVFGGFIPHGGLPLEIQYRDGRRWRTYDQTRARARDGRFVYHYTFRRTTLPVVYTFRVRTPAAGVAGYPYVPGASRARSVRVDP